MTKTNIKSFFRFSSVLAILLVLVFTIHLFALKTLQYSLFNNKIILAYAVNYSLVLLSYVSLILLQKNFAETLGYIFIGGSSVKVIAFFILFNPSYKLDGNISRPEFSAFFIPYAFCLIIEVIFLIKLLKD